MAFESGHIDWLALQNYFGGGNPIGLNEYYRGALVPNVAGNAGVPTGGTIAASHFRGSTNVSNTIAKSGNATASRFQAEPAPGSASMTTNTVTISGSGLSSVTWSLVSGATMTLNQSGLNASWTTSVPKNTEKSAVYRATGNHGLWIDVSVTCTYTTDA